MADLQRRWGAQRVNVSGGEILAASLLFFTQGPTLKLIEKWQLAQNDRVFNTVKLAVYEGAKLLYSLHNSTMFPCHL